jgi:hypothetical protein
MSRPLLEFAGKFCHVTARVNEQRNIFLGNITMTARRFSMY